MHSLIRPLCQSCIEMSFLTLSMKSLPTRSMTSNLTNLNSSYKPLLRYPYNNNSKNLEKNMGQLFNAESSDKDIKIFGISSKTIIFPVILVLFGLGIVFFIRSIQHFLPLYISQQKRSNQEKNQKE